MDDIAKVICDETDDMVYECEAYSPPYGAKCPECSSTDITSNDNYHWVCRDCGKKFTTMDIQY